MSWDGLIQTARRVKALGLRLWRHREIFFRGFVGWGAAAILLLLDSSGTHDWRYRLRGPRPAMVDSRIVIIDVNERDWTSLNPHSRNLLRPLKELGLTTDAFFWNTRLWEDMLSRVLADLPLAVGVTLHFGDGVRMGSLGPATRSLFEDPRVVWGADLDSGGRALIPVFATTYNRNVAVRSLRADDDGTLRRYSNSLVQIPHMGVRLAELAERNTLALQQALSTPSGSGSGANTQGQIQPIKNYEGSDDDLGLERTSDVNFVAGTGNFPIVSMRDLLEGRVPPEAFHRKVVLIGHRSQATEIFTTALGRMSRAEVIANIVDNHLQRRIPQRLPAWVYLGLMGVLAIFSVRFILLYPQAVVLVGLGLGALAWISVSAWVFDRFAIWLPALAPIAQLVITYVLFLSWQVGTNEARAWQLEQDRRAAEQLEQLKTNFVSMMSHDLKTPIAKIQSICDRLMSQAESERMAEDLRNLRRSSDELHRYIRSILQVSKIEAREMAILREPVDLNEVLFRVIGRLKPLAQEKGLTLDSDFEPLFSIEADSTLLEEIAHNLVENAIKYTPAGGTVTVASSEIGNDVVVTVKDTGPGIPEAEQPGIWAKFTRGSGASTSPGTGLGLYLVKYFVELHGGEVFLRSQVGQGTEIGFKLPM